MTVPVPVQVGELLRLRESDYYFGRGTLTLRVTQVPDRLTNPEWIVLRGIEINWAGDRLNEIQVRARVSALLDPRSRFQ